MSVISANVCDQKMMVLRLMPEDHHFIFLHQQSSLLLLISLSVSSSYCFKYNLSNPQASVIGVGVLNAVVLLQRQQQK